MSDVLVAEDGAVVTPRRETRTVSDLQLRSVDGDGGGVMLAGYAIVYDTRYQVGDFTEMIARGAAAKTAREADVRLLVNHSGVPLARTKSGTMKIESDDIGLRVEANLDPLNPSVMELRSAMDRGDLDQMSFAFRTINDEWTPGRKDRTIRELKLFDVSVVTFPANPTTVAQLRDTSELAEAAAVDPDAEVEDTATGQVGGRSVEMAKRQLEALSTRQHQ